MFWMDSRELAIGMPSSSIPKDKYVFRVSLSKLAGFQAVPVWINWWSNHDYSPNNYGVGQHQKAKTIEELDSCCQILLHRKLIWTWNTQHTIMVWTFALPGIRNFRGLSPNRRALRATGIHTCHPSWAHWDESCCSLKKDPRKKVVT